MRMVIWEDRPFAKPTYTLLQIPSGFILRVYYRDYIHSRKGGLSQLAQILREGAERIVVSLLDVDNLSACTILSRARADRQIAGIPET